METLIVKKEIVTDASRQRVWDLLGTLLFDSIEGMEKLDILDEFNFNAELKAKAFGIPLTMQLKGEIMDITALEGMTVRLTAQNKFKPIAITQKISFKLSSEKNEGARMVCQSVGENLNPLVRLFLLGQVKGMASQIFNSMEERLKQLA